MWNIELNGFDCSDLKWKLHEGVPGHGTLERGAHWRNGLSGPLHNDRGAGAETWSRA